jgi:hypothetical protein
MHPLLSVQRLNADGRTSDATLLRDDGGRLHLRRTNGATKPLASATVEQALRQSRLLHVVRASEETAIQRHDPSISADTVLAALRPTSDEPAEIDDWDEHLDYPFDDWVEMTPEWSLPHRVTLDDEPLLVVALADGTPVCVSLVTDPIEADWDGILVFDWDSSTYAGVGNAGWGSQGLYRPRRDLVVEMSSEDGAVQNFTAYRSNLSASRLARAFSAKTDENAVLTAYLDLSPANGTLALTEPHEGDQVTSTLTRRQLQWLVRQIAADWPTADSQT